MLVIHLLNPGFLTGRYKSPADFASSDDAFDFRSMLPRMQAEVWEHNYKIVEAFEKLASKKGITGGQLALAWLVSRGENIVPIPGVGFFHSLSRSFRTLIDINIRM